MWALGLVVPREREESIDFTRGPDHRVGRRLVADAECRGCVSNHFFLFGGGARAAGAGEPRVVWFGLESTKELVQLLLAMCRRWTKAICLLPWQEADGTGLQVPTPCDADSRVRRARQPLCSFHPSISNGNNADHCGRGHHGTARHGT